MGKYHAYRIIGSKPGCVDYLGEFNLNSEQEVEDVCRLMFDFDWAGGDSIDIEDEDYDQKEAAWVEHFCEPRETVSTSRQSQGGQEDCYRQSEADQETS